MNLDFLKFLGEAKAKYALVATYEFDPLFFEQRILPTKSFSSADRILVFMDEGRYGELLASGRQGAQFDRRYFVVPIRCDQGVFHPKLYLTIGDRACLASVGSNNCTASGTGHNFELISAFKADLNAETHSSNEPVHAAVFQLFRRMALDAGPLAKTLEKEIFAPIERAFPWINNEYPTSEANGLEVLSNFDATLLSQVIGRLKKRKVEKVILFAPYFDKRLSIVERAKSAWPNAPIEVIAQPSYSNLPTAILQAVQEANATIQLFSATSQASGRNVHAKALAFETPKETFWLTGSANISHAALEGGNREVCLWFSTKQRPSAILAHEDLAISPISPGEFEERPIPEPEPLPTITELQIRFVRLTEQGSLLGTIQAPPVADEISLRLIRKGEQHPFLVRPLSRSQRDFEFPLDEELCRSFDRPVLAFLQAEVDGKMETSSPTSVAQLARLLVDRSDGGRIGNRLNRIEDTGEGVVDYANALHDVNDVIEFFNNVNIRFDDGSKFSGRPPQRWRARDPFSTDVPDSWMLGTTGSSVEELREAIWGFVQRHVDKKLEKHVARGNLNGLPNFMDIFRTLTGLLLAFHHRQVDGETVLPAPYVTKGLQQVLSALIGTLPVAQQSLSLSRQKIESSPGVVRSVRENLAFDDALLNEHLERQRIAATAMTTIDELIRARSIALNRPSEDKWSLSRRKWVSEWLSELGLAVPSDTELQEVCEEFRFAA